MFGEFPAAKILRELEQDNLLPAILFRTSRRQCDIDVERLAERRKAALPKERQQDIRRVVHDVVQKYGFEEEVIFEHPQFESLVRTGVGAHHAGQLLLWRLLLEELMTAGVLRILVATGTVAAGVDFPARSVVITAHSKRGSEGFHVLSASEFQQMSGRGGRRGKDTVGFCLIAPSKFSDARIIHEVASKPPEPLRSAYFAAPATVLNLLKHRSEDELRYTVSKSLASFLDKKSAASLRGEAEKRRETAAEGENESEHNKKRALKRARRMERDADILANRQEALLNESLAGLRRLQYLDERGLTAKGLWAAELCTSLVLELAEAIDAGLFYEVEREGLVALVASIAGDSYRTYMRIQKNPIPQERYDKLQSIVEMVASAYQKPESMSEVVVLPDAAVTVLGWLDAEDWTTYAGLLRLGGVTEGDAARLISQTADHLNQLSRLSEAHPEIARLAEDARMSLLKPPLTDTLLANE